MKTTNATRQLGFTLVELLVVIAIIGILMALTLPAIQSARESGRRTECNNKLRQITLGANSHLQAQSFYPSGGWGYRWGSDPDQGYGITQPGGWLYNILPYIEEQNLHDRGKGLSDAERARIGAERVGTYVALFNCPTRRRPEKFVYNVKPYSRYGFYNLNEPPFYAASDYAGNGGDVGMFFEGQAGALKKNRSQVGNVGGSNYSKNTGLITAGAEWKAANILDGLSKTYYAGERYLHFSNYETGLGGSDDSGWDSGYDHDSIRWTHVPPNFDNTTDSAATASNANFGAAHTMTFNMSFADGATRAIPYDIDPLVHRQLGNRKDGLPSDLSSFQ